MQLCALLLLNSWCDEFFQKVLSTLQLTLYNEVEVYMGITKKKFKHWFDKFSIKFSKVFFLLLLVVLESNLPFDKTRKLFLHQVMEYKLCMCFASALSYRSYTFLVFFSIRMALLWIKWFNLHMEMNTVISQHHLLVLLSNVSQKHPTL